MTGGWEGLDPWDKAAQWRAVDPQISAELVRLAKAKAIQDRREQAERAKREAERDRFELEEAQRQAERNHELRLKEEESNRDYRSHVEQRERDRDLHDQQVAIEQVNIAKERLAIQKLLQTRMWWLQVIAMVGGFIAIASLIVTGVNLGQSGSISSTGITMFSLGASLTAALLGANISVGRRVQAILRGEPAKAGLEDGSPPAEENGKPGSEGL